MKILPTTITALIVFAFVVLLPPLSTATEENGEVKGSFTVNEQTVELKFGYLHQEDEKYIVSLTDVPIEYRKLDGLWTMSDVNYVQLKFQADGTHLGHDLKHHAKTGVISGSGVQEIELTQSGADGFAGRAYIPEPEEFFDDTYQYDVTFKVRVPGADELGGTKLPAGGGEPGAAFLAFTNAVMEGNLDKLKTLVPPDMAGALEEQDANEMLEMMQLMTPKDIKIIGGTLFGEEEAVLEVEGVNDGEKQTGTITMTKSGDFWIQSDASWKQL